ncbi:MAG: MMPL family transporter [Planctomycetota bacterium]
MRRDAINNAKGQPANACKAWQAAAAAIRWQITVCPAAPPFSMIANQLRRLINGYWWVLLIAWMVGALVLHGVAPRWEDVALDGDLDYLPASSPSLEGSRLLREAFPDAQTKSQAVLVFARSGEKLTVEDRQFALDLARAIEKLGPLAPLAENATAEERAEHALAEQARQDSPDAFLPIVDVWHAKTDIVASMLLAEDKRAELVVVRLTNGLMAFGNIGVRQRLRRMIEEAEADKPGGLQVGLTGSAIIGGDMRSAVLDSLAATHQATLILVLACLLVIYRAPLLVLIPLATIGISMTVAYDAVALLADNFGPEDFSWSKLRIFTTTKIFVVVILFGAGTDYCLFLIARYKEELQSGTAANQAPGVALSRVGSALAGSALTTILGLATMVFADYGKFSCSGPVIAICLSVALLACVTFAPALLRALGPRVFWPFSPKGAAADSRPGSPLWRRLSAIVQRWPASILVASAIVSAPMVMAGWQVDVTHDLLGELPRDSVSVEGARLVREYFGDGWVAPITVVAELEEGDLHERSGRYDVARLHDMLYRLPQTADVRSLYLPTGGDPERQSIFNWDSLTQRAAAGSALTVGTFVSETPEHNGRVSQLSVVLRADPFAKTAREQIPAIRTALEKFSRQSTVGKSDKPNPWYGARFELAGVTPGMFDLERVTNSDRTRIQVCTVAAVFGVLLVILRRPLVCAYLLLTVLLSYWATIGITEVFFSWFFGASYHGLDWKAPIFLFVILVAVGQDYNIYLTTRVLEEQAKLGRVAGLRRAVVQTGGIITSCGVIMAGTFVSMSTSTLRGMIELGFALSLGVLLDTFFVRTVVVPCFFALEARWREGRAAATPEAPKA